MKCNLCNDLNDLAIFIVKMNVNENKCTVLVTFMVFLNFKHQATLLYILLPIPAIIHTGNNETINCTIV